MKKFELLGEITDENINAAIQFLEANKNEEEITFYIDSPGGNVFSGLQLFRAMDNFTGKIVAEVGVLAASMAAFIALACDEIHITKDTFMLLHPAWCATEGNASDLRATADLLEQASVRLGEVVSLKAKDKEAVSGYMSKDTWFGANAILDAFEAVVLDESSRFDAKVAVTYSLLKSEKPVELAAMLVEPKAEPEPKVDVDNTFALSVLAKAKNYI